VVSEQAVKSKTEDPIQLFAMKLCLMQVCDMSLASQVNDVTKSLLGSKGLFDDSVVPNAQAESPSKRPSLLNGVEDAPAVVQGLQAKLDQILEVVHESSERCA
jgi:hypothetical protein